MKLSLLLFEPSDDQMSKQAHHILSSKLRRLHLYASQSPTGYGFLELPVLVTAPKEAEERPERILEQLENIQLKIKDVDVNAVIKAVQAIFTPPQYELIGRLTKLSNEVEVSCELVYKDYPFWSWHSRSRFKTSNASEGAGVADELPDEAGAINKVLDDVLFQMIYDFMTQKSFEGWKISMKGEYRPKNWQALQAYILGVQALRAYQQNIDHKDLQEALCYLERLPIVAPDEPYGFYYYGIALSEDRQEEEAVAVFEQLQRLLSAKLEMDNRKPEVRLYFEKTKLEAKFNEATARLKLYQLKEGIKAAETLNQLISELNARIMGIMNDRDLAEEWYYRKLLTISKAQLAYAHGTILSFRGHEKSYTPEQRYKVIEDSLKFAEDEYKKTGEEKWGSERERDDVWFRIKNAEGYSKFRYAQYQFKQNKDENAFRAECYSAIKILEEADRARPNHYEVLQNMAMIYEDEQFDPSGTYLDIAETLYERTKRFVPNDYYRYEHLAYVQRRRLEQAGLSASAKVIIEKGKSNALKAVGLRPRTPGALLSLARFGVRSWEIAIAENQEANQIAPIATEAINYFKEALAIRPYDSTIQSEYANFLMQLADAQSKNPEVQLQRGRDLLEFAKGIGVNENENKARFLNEVIRLLDRAINLTKGKQDKEEIRDEAQKLHDEAQKLRDEIQSADAQLELEQGSVLLQLAKRKEIKSDDKTPFLSEALRLFDHAINLTRGKQGKQETHNKALKLHDEAQQKLFGIPNI